MTNTILLEIPKNGVAHEQKFITANSQNSSLQTIRNQHIIPVFVKDNQPTISQADFIQTTVDLSEDFFGIRAKKLAVRVSHPIKGRIFEARNKRLMIC
ncbi:MAG: DUF3871 family protein [Bacteroidota bacterium]